MGTNNDGPRFSRGNQYPGVHTPFGMNAWSPASQDPDNSWFYQFTDKTFTGFKLSHQPSVWAQDHASLAVMPMTGPLKTGPRQRQSQVSKDNEIASPYFYQQKLLSYDTVIKFAPTNRAGIFQFNFPAKESWVLIDSKNPLKSSSNKLGPKEIEGSITNSGITLYYNIVFNQEISSVKRRHDMNVAVNFAKGGLVEMRMGTSYISRNQAKSNRLLELGERTLAEIVAAGKKEWNEILSNIEVEGGNDEYKRTFYSAMYRTYAFPKVFWEPQGEDFTKAQYRSPYDGEVHLDRKLWSGNGFWDTYRAVWPFFTIMYPSMTGEMLDGWVNSYRDGGWTARWSNPGYWECMISTHTDLIFADAYIKGIRNWDYQTGYEASIKNATQIGGYRGKGRRFMDRYQYLGYVPWTGLNDNDEVGARTVEHGVNDFGIARWAEALGKDTDASYFMNRSRGYLNLWSPEVRHFRAKDDKGEYRTSTETFDPYAWRYAWTEGNSWHYRTAPMHDGHGLAELFGGRGELAQGIDEVLSASTHFSVGGYGREIHEMTEAKAIGEKGFGQFALGNQPIQHMLHMYNFTDSPWKAQKWVRKAMTELFSSGLKDGYGYPGDEDNGQTSVWYVMNAIGLYSTSPGFPEYTIVSPLFSKASLKLESGKIFHMEAVNNNEKNIYIQEAYLNGRVLSKNYLSHTEIQAGGTLQLIMGSEPSSWGSRPEDSPSGITPIGEQPRYYKDLADSKSSFARGDSPQNETSSFAFDDDSNSKWLVYDSIGMIGTKLVEARGVNLYTISSGNDFPNRDPKSWILEGSSDGETWNVLDRQESVSWQGRQQLKIFEVESANNDSQYSYYRINILENHGAEETQISEIEFLQLPK